MRLAAALLALACAGAALPARAFGPATNYAIHCQGCHLEDGAGRPARCRRSLVRSRVSLRRAGGPRIPRARAGRRERAARRRELAALLDWTLRRFAGAGASGARRITADEVGALRSAPLADVAGARVRLLGP